MKLYVIRHGETDWNIEKRAQGQTDIELNQNGINQALEAKQIVQNLDIDLIISSPLKRAAKTAEILSEGKYEIIYDDRLKERCFGDIEGKRLEDINFEEIYNVDLNLSIYNIEPINDLFTRLNNFLSNIKTKYNDKTILLVSHGGVLRTLTACIEGIPKTRTLASQGYKNCEIREFNI
jgi:broad specificity phosphatase PhoE